MTQKAAEKIIDALIQLMEGYRELSETIEDDYGADDDDEDSKSEKTVTAQAEAGSALITELKAAIEGVIESEDYTPNEIAVLLTSFVAALEEIDPDVFDEAEMSDVEEDEDYDDDDDDDYDYDEDEDEDEEDSDEDE